MWPQVVFIVLYHLKLIKDFHCTLNLWKTCQHVSSTGDSIQEALVQNLMEERSILKAKTQVKLGVRMCFFFSFSGLIYGLGAWIFREQKNVSISISSLISLIYGFVTWKKIWKILHLLIHIMNMAYIGGYACFSDAPIWWYPTWNRVLTTY